MELSYAVARVERSCGMDAFIARVEELKREIPQQQKEEAIEMAMEILQEEGIVAVGDICNTPLTAKAKHDSNIHFRNFIEVYGLDPKVAAQKIEQAQEMAKAFKNSSIVPHAPYSLSKELFALLTKNIRTSDIWSIHHQESKAEDEYFRLGTGPLKTQFEQWKLPMPSFIPSGKNAIQTIGKFLPQHTSAQIFVHNTQSRAEDLSFIAQHFSHPWFCLCPSSNLFIEHELPQLEEFSMFQDRICLGTDSLASNDTLSILHEMKVLEKHFPDLELETLFRWSSLHGAKALGFEASLGSFEQGKKPGVLCIEEADVENQKLGDFSFVNVLA